jgi:hypothetical protein
MSRGLKTHEMLQDAEQISTRMLEEAGVLLPERLKAVKQAWDNAVQHLDAQKGMASKEGVVYVPDNQAQARAREHIFGVNRIAFNGNHADSQPVVNVQVVVQGPSWDEPSKTLDIPASEVKQLSERKD